MSSKIFTGPPDSGTPVLGKTLPDLLYDADAQYDNPQFLNQPTDGTWEPLSLSAFREHAEEAAVGLLTLDLHRGDRVALFMESDVHFCVADMGCLIAGLIDVPIYLSHADEAIEFVLTHSEARAIVVSDAERLSQLAPVLEDTPAVKTVIVAQPSHGDMYSIKLPGHVQVLSMEELREQGRAVMERDEATLAALREQIAPQDLATIIYTSGTTGEPKGVMLTHENISYNALTAFSGMKGYVPGPDGETIISFLPLTHIFARMLHYGYLSQGTSVYFTTADDLGEDLKRVRPTIFAAVPRVLEKVYGSILKKASSLEGVQKRILNWALDLAAQYEIGGSFSTWYRTQLAVADRLVFRKWREALGGRLKFAVIGGAALSEDLTNTFAAAKIDCLQGYGLTESSPVIAFNRPEDNRPGTVGVPLPKVEVKIAEDGEILTRGPHVMKGYYRNEERTREAIDDAGWLHTGDIGEIDEDGFLRITDRKKDLFKLSTGKYVMPAPLENRLMTHPLIEQAVVVGEGNKFCSALLFPDEDALAVYASSKGLDAGQGGKELLKEPAVIRRYEELVEEANRGMDHWSTIKRFALIPEHLTVENDMLTPTLKVKRRKLYDRYEGHIQRLYTDMGHQAFVESSVLVAPEVQNMKEKAPA